jgi:hypothetical protein
MAWGENDFSPVPFRLKNKKKEVGYLTTRWIPDVGKVVPVLN